jgi:chromatin remodeling complex protein RSC6
VDNTINDLLDKGVQVMSPQTHLDRKQKRQHWEDVQAMVVPEWTMTMEERKKRATEAAARHLREFMRLPGNQQGTAGLMAEGREQGTPLD